MNAILSSGHGLLCEATDGWNRFWFRATEPHTLALIRILTGAMLFYTHLVWAFDLAAFLGPTPWMTYEAWDTLHRGEFVGSYLWLIRSPGLLWTVHVAALCVFALLTVGWCSRAMSVLAWFMTINYCHRLTGSLFGLDQVNAMLAMYLMVGPCGDAYSVDRLIARRKAGQGRGGECATKPRVATNIAIRLIQLHLCVIYFFGGLSKMHGTAWWDGSATWMAVANYEYQSIDMTWLARSPHLIALLTHVTVFWEAYYCFLVWPRVTRPVVLLVAVAVHGGIALFLGMMTFGGAMLIANLAFVSPHVVSGAVNRLLPGEGRGGQGSVPRRTLRTKPGS